MNVTVYMTAGIRTGVAGSQAKRLDYSATVQYLLFTCTMSIDQAIRAIQKTVCNLPLAMFTDLFKTEALQE